MRSVLIIMDAFAPENSCATIPNTKLVKYLARQDLKITLITKAVTPDMNLDESLVPKEISSMRVLRVDYGKVFSSTVQASRNKMTENGVKQKMKKESRPFRALLVSAIKETYFGLRSRDWLNSARKLIRKELQNEHFDCIYSTFPDVAAHTLAEELMKKGMADRWIADFRDPMYYEYHDSFANQHKHRLQMKIEKKADHVTIVSEGALDKFLCDDVAEDKITYIPNGYDPEDMDNIEAKPTAGVLRIFYAGSLYWGKRDLTVVFRALRELADEGVIDLNKILIEYAGKEWDVMESFAEKYDLLSICKNYGFITRKKVVEILSEVDCTAVCSHNTAADKGVVTGKVFELLMVGKPIITVVNGDVPDSELGRIVRQCDAGIVYEQATDERDYAALKLWLLEKYKQKQECGHVSCSVKTEERDKYSYANIARQLYELMVR